MAGTFSDSSTDAINNILTQEANRIGSDIHKATLHTSPWIDLIRQSAFPEGMGYQLNTLIYDRALPIKNGGSLASGNTGVDWTALQTGSAGGSDIGFTSGQTTASAALGDEKKATLDFTRVLKSYSLSKAVVESPRINVEDLRYAAHRAEQLRAIMDLMKESVRNTWENRYRDEYDRLADNCVLCKSASTTFITDGENKQSFVIDDSDGLAQAGTTVKTGDLDDDDDGTGELEPSGNISNAVMDKIYFQLIRAGAGLKAYGRENGRPIFSVVLSSEASHQLLTEDDKIRDDIRYNNAKVGELIAPLGVEKSFRGFYHLVDDLTTRYKSRGGQANTLVKVEPYIVSGNKVIVNPAYESAEFEAAYVLVDDVMESLVPQPITSAPGMTFDPIQYTGDFAFRNIPDATNNPDGNIGFFRGIMASASKPIKTQFGYVVIFKRDTDTASVV
tara:strand:+ start:1338 stop:2675 length:1338 start_codon:yes stop_codon:yes gene_type:complete